MPLLSLSCPPAQGGSWGEGYIHEEQASFHPQLERTNGFTGEEVTILPPHSCHLCTVHVLMGGRVLWVLGSSQGPLTCLWQLWRGLGEGERSGRPPPSQAVQGPALGVEAVAGQPGLCQSPSQGRWGQGPQLGWEWGQGQQHCPQGVVQGEGPPPLEAAPWAWLPA